MDNTETLAVLGTQNTRGTQTKQKITQNRKLKRCGNTDPDKNQG